ncbi:sex determination protein tasselseed-2 [Auriscalpium vulgare]|uniref:Sex determination protein tasselseed-2 n=1 Tax=Auriscalpium vulgare TaxID=40419 RepID=A0ACB8S6M1_9AGAM|nr:sex determination protein tasselseed-2 [Auriscalpium vulgare]
MAPPKQPTLKLGSPEEHHRRTVARISQIQSHLEQAPRGTKLKGKVCVITGVGSLKGIGRAAALLFANEGAHHLYLLDFSDANLPNLKDTIAQTYPDVKTTVIQADAADEASISSVCEQALKEEGRLDVFFANAGIASGGTLHETSSDMVSEILRVNVLSCFLAVKYASAAMKKTNESRGKDSSSGSIVLTASIAGVSSGAGSVEYSASKAAVNSIAKTSAWQLQRTDIRVNSISPGLIETGMTTGTFEYARQRGNEAKIGQLNPMGRYGVAEEIAQAALFLASDDSSYVNGQNLVVDGGLTASVPVVPGKFL